MLICAVNKSPETRCMEMTNPLFFVTGSRWTILWLQPCPSDSGGKDHPTPWLLAENEAGIPRFECRPTQKSRGEERANRAK